MSDSEITTSSPNVSRRELLASAVTVPINPVSAFCSRRTPGAFDPILPLWRNRQRLHALAVDLCRRWQEMETHLIRMIGFPQVMVPSADPRKGICTLSHEEIDNALGTWEHSLDSKGRLHAQLAEHQARWNSEAQRIGFYEADREQLRAWKAEAEATQRIFDTRATTLTGIEIKIAVMAHLCRTGSSDPDFPLSQLRSTLMEVKRLRRLLDVEGVDAPSAGARKCQAATSRREAVPTKDAP